MATVTVEDVRRLEQVERELAESGREPERAAVRKAAALLRAELVRRLERGLEPLQPPSSADDLPHPAPAAEHSARLAELLRRSDDGGLTPSGRRELQDLLNQAEARAMRETLAALRHHAPDSDAYLRSLRAYRRSFARYRKSAPTAARTAASTDHDRPAG
jgi:hypothetical protein